MIAVMALQALLLAAALWRKHDCVTWALGAAFCASLIVSMLPLDELHVPLAMLDYAVVFVMLGVWTKHSSMRAYAIGFIGMAKLAMRSSYMIEPYMNHWAFAAAINCAFMAQVVIAGGMANGIGSWLDDRLRRYMPVRYGLLRNVAH